MDAYNGKECFGFDPDNVEDCRTTLGEIAMFINAERVALGKPRAKSFIVIGADVPYNNFQGEEMEPA